MRTFRGTPARPQWTAFEEVTVKLRLKKESYFNWEESQEEERATFQPVNTRISKIHLRSVTGSGGTSC